MRKKGIIAGLLTGVLFFTGCSCANTLNTARDAVGDAISGVINGIQLHEEPGTFNKWEKENKDTVEDIDRKTSEYYEEKVDQVEREQEAYFEENGKHWYGRPEDE